MQEGRKNSSTHISLMGQKKGGKEPFSPVELGQRRARSSNRISRSQFIVRVWILNIWVLLSKSGRPNSTFRSNRPGRSNAGSKVSGLKICTTKETSKKLVSKLWKHQILKVHLMLCRKFYHTLELSHLKLRIISQLLLMLHLIHY